MTARVHKLHYGLEAIYACWPECKICLLAGRQNLPIGRRENSARRPAGNGCLKGSQRAKSASQMSADTASLQSAEFARDSINYLINYSYLL